jgi:branched-subunit amino acid transport protein
MKVLLLIFGMSLVTMIPRLIPAWISSDSDLPGWLQRWLESIPYAALGALIFPGIILVEREDPWFGLVGGITAAVLALLKLDLTVVMAGAVAVVLLYEHLF